jgi:hypothetical protein
MDDFRVCTKCDVLLPIGAFRIDRKPKKNTICVTYECLSCYNAYLKKYRQANKVKISEQKAAWHQQNKHSIKDRYHNDVQFKLRHQLRVRLNGIVAKNQKVGSAVNDLGCSTQYLKKHIESKWQPGMTWDNWTKDGWHIDHIRPLSSFDLSDRSQLLQACNYTNLQPLWATDNLIKGSKVGGDLF